MCVCVFGGGYDVDQTGYECLMGSGGGVRLHPLAVRLV